jgi:CysZ protein
VRDLIDGFLGIPRAFELLSTRKIGKFVIIAGLFGLIIGIGLSLILYYNFDNIGDWLVGLYPFEWGRSVVLAIGKWIAFLLGFLILAFSFKYIVIILLSPILSHISEVIEADLTGNTSQPFSVGRLFNEIGRSLRINSRNIFKELFYTIILFFIGLFPIPGIGILTTLTIVGIQGYYMGFGNLDFLLERHLNYKDSVRFVKNNRMMATGNGLGFLLLFSIPVIGFILAPTLSVIGATVEGLERLDEMPEH